MYGNICSEVQAQGRYTERLQRLPHRLCQNHVFLLQEVSCHRMPRRIATSLEVQQTPATLMPFAPISFAYAIISGSSAYSQIISDSDGSCPCTMMFTSSSFITPRFASVSTGFGVPNRISENSVPSWNHPIRRTDRNGVTGESKPPAWKNIPYESYAWNEKPRGQWHAVRFLLSPRFPVYVPEHVSGNAEFQTAYRTPSDLSLLLHEPDHRDLCPRFQYPTLCDAEQLLRIFYLIVSVCR